METIPPEALDIGNELQNGELLEKITALYSSLWDRPQYIHKILNGISEVKVRIGRREPQSLGFTSVLGYVLPEVIAGKIEYEIGIPVDLSNSKNLGTFVEETTHLFHMILNQSLNKIIVLESELEAKLDALAIRDRAYATNMIVSTDFLSKTRSVLGKYEELCGTFSRPNLRELLVEYFRSSTGMHKMNVEVKDLLTYVEYARKNGLITSISEKGIRSLKTKVEQIKKIKEKHRDLHISAARKDPTNEVETERYIEASGNLARKQRELENSPIVMRARNELIRIINDTPDEELEDLSLTFGLNGLVETVWLDRIVKNLGKLPEAVASHFMRATLENASGKLLNRFHWEMRPGGYGVGREVTEEWFRATSDDIKRPMVLDRLPIYKDSSLNKLVLIALEEELGQLYCESVSESSAISSSLFWDLPEDSDLGSNPEYVRENIKAIQKAIRDGNLLSTSELQDLTKGTTSDIKPHISTQVADLITGNTDLLDVRMTTANAAAQTDARKRFMDGANFTALQHTVQVHIMTTKEILSKGEDIRTVLNIAPYINSLNQQLNFIRTNETLLLEIVAKAVVLYLTGEIHEISDESGFISSYGIHLGATDQNKKSVWESFITSIVEYLERKDSYGFIQVLMCKDIPTIAKLIGYEA